MTGNRQTLSGTAFDPLPQFWAHGVVTAGPLTETGRCWLAPVTIGTVFTALTAPSRHRPAAAVPCRLPIEEISLYDHPADELDLTPRASS